MEKGISSIMDPGLIKQINQRVQEELLKKEIEVVQYRLTELERIWEKDIRTWPVCSRI